MIKVIKEELKKLGFLNINDDSSTCNTPLGTLCDEFNRLSKIDDDLFTYEVVIPGLASILCEDDSDNGDLDIYEPRTRGDDEIELTDEESSDADDENLIDENEVAKIFRIETNVFDFKTPACRAFKEFNYLLQIHPDVLTKDIDGFTTYEEYKDDWIYEWNKDIPWVHEKPWIDNGAWEETTPVEHIVNHSHLKVDIQNGQLVAGKMTDIVIVGTCMEHTELGTHSIIKI
ncbi:hypothetical protein Tco_1319168 [Tanacetum coccineum]